MCSEMQDSPTVTAPTNKLRIIRNIQKSRWREGEEAESTLKVEVKRIAGFPPKCTHRLPSDPRQNEEQADRQQQEDQGDGEQAAAEESGSPLQAVERVNVMVEGHLGAS